jgi:hypothetical protein
MLLTREQAVAVRIYPMNSSILRQIWLVIEETHTNILLGFNDAELTQQLLKQLENKKFLTSEETGVISAYISSRVPLIRDLALARSMA